MRFQRACAFWTLVLAASGCASRHAGEKSEGLARVETAKISIAQAIHAASAGREGYLPVAVIAGDEDGTGGPILVALIRSGRVVEIEVDAATGEAKPKQERPVSDAGFAAQIERELPIAKFDLARAVDAALAEAPGARPVEVFADLDGDRLVYRVNLVTEDAEHSLTVDAQDGSVHEEDQEMDEEHEMNGDEPSEGAEPPEAPGMPEPR